MEGEVCVQSLSLSLSSRQPPHTNRGTSVSETVTSDFTTILIVRLFCCLVLADEENEVLRQGR